MRLANSAFENSQESEVVTRKSDKYEQLLALVGTLPALPTAVVHPGTALAADAAVGHLVASYLEGAAGVLAEQVDHRGTPGRRTPDRLIVVMEPE